jgi:hypothetical protein
MKITNIRLATMPYVQPRMIAKEGRNESTAPHRVTGWAGKQRREDENDADDDERSRNVPEDLRDDVHDGTARGAV